MARLTDLPREMIKEIISYLDHTSDFLSLTLACKSTSPVALGRLYQKIDYCPGLESSSGGLRSIHVRPVRVQRLAHLVRSLSSKDFPPLIQELFIGREIHSAAKGALVSTLLNLAAPSLRALDIDTISLGGPPRMIPRLPRLPLLSVLEVYHEETKLRQASTTETLSHLPSLRHLKLYNIQLLASERFGTLLQSAPSLKSLSIEIHDQDNLPEQSRGDGLLPVGLARVLQLMRNTLEDLLFEYSEVVGLAQNSSVINGCLSCHIGSLAQFTKL